MSGGDCPVWYCPHCSRRIEGFPEGYCVLSIEVIE